MEIIIFQIGYFSEFMIIIQVILFWIEVNGENDNDVLNVEVKCACDSHHLNIIFSKIHLSVLPLSLLYNIYIFIGFTKNAIGMLWGFKALEITNLFL